MMALSEGSLKGQIISNLEAMGFITKGDHARVQDLADAIAKAVVSEITSNAEVAVTSGSSAGKYKVS